MKTILITGGAGFIGSHIAESLLQKGYTVRIYDNFSSGYKENLNSIIHDVELIEGDILQNDTLLSAMEGVDVVSHHAAQLEITKCIASPIEDLRINTIGTLRVLDAAVQKGVPRFINISSACVYGQAVQPPNKEDEHPLNPNWQYGISKLAAEKYASIYNDTKNIAVTTLRYAIVYGEREWCGRVLTMFLKRVLEGKRPVIFGDGKQRRDFINVHDAVGLHNRCIENSASIGKIYNASTGTGTTIKDLARIVSEIAQVKGEPIFEDIKEGEISKEVPGRIRLPQELNTMILSNEKASKELDWHPRIGLREGVAQEFEWIKRNRHRWDTFAV